MNKSDPLLFAKLKIERADRHINDLDLLAPDWSLGGGYRFIVDDGSQPGGKQLLRLELLPPKNEAALMVGEAVYQLRSTLDVATVTMARINSPNCNINDVYFPMYGSREDFLKKISSEKNSKNFLMPQRLSLSP